MSEENEIEVSFDDYQQKCSACVNLTEVLTPIDICEEAARFSDKRTRVKIRCSAVHCRVTEQVKR